MHGIGFVAAMNIYLAHTDSGSHRDLKKQKGALEVCCSSSKHTQILN